MDLLNELEKFNLTSSEAKVYLASLELGPESIQRLAAKAKLNRVTLYGLIDSLIDKGYLREEYVKNKRRIAAYPPMKLYDIVGQEKERVENKIARLGTVVPALKGLARQDKSSTNIIYYEGEEGLKNWASDALESKGEVLEWTKIESFSKPFSNYLKRYYFPEKKRRQIPARFILLDTPEAHEYIEKNYMLPKDASPMKARFIAEDLFNTPGYMAIFNDRFTIALPKEMRAVTVVDPLIADSQRKIFEFGWLSAKGEMQNKPYPV